MTYLIEVVKLGAEVVGGFWGGLGYTTKPPELVFGIAGGFVEQRRGRHRLVDGTLGEGTLRYVGL